MNLYLAYGSNLNLEQMAMRCPGAEMIGYTYLLNTRLVFRGSGTGSFLSVETARGCSTPCGVFSITDKDEAALDRYEGYPRFYKKRYYQNLTFYTMDGERVPVKITAMAYLLPSSAPAGMPSKSYMKTCLTGYRDFGFQPEVLYAAELATKKLMKEEGTK